MKIILNNNINIINLPGIPLLTVELACNTSFLLYFIIFKKAVYKTRPFPLKKAFTFVFISIFISTLLSKAGISSITNSIATIINSYLFVYILWRVLKTEDDIRFVLKGFFVVFTFLLTYGVFEKITGLNPIYEYQLLLNKYASKIIEWNTGERLGMIYIRSAISHPIGLGILVAGFFNLYLYIITSYKYIWCPHWLITMLFMMLSIFVIFFTNVRSPFIFLLIAFIGLLNFKKKTTYRLLFIIIILIIISINIIKPYIPNILSLLDPFFNNLVVYDVGGSSIDMRMMQFNTAIKAVKGNALFGLGIESFTIVKSKYPSLYGLESVWLWLLTERGVLGIISHIYLLYSVLKMGKGNNKYFIIYMTFAWFAVTTITSTPGCGIEFFFTIIIIVTKIELLKTQTNTL